MRNFYLELYKEGKKIKRQEYQIRGYRELYRTIRRAFEFEKADIIVLRCPGCPK